MKTTLLRPVILLLALLCLALPARSAEVPEAGLRAEMAGRWEEALEIYRQELSRSPERIDLWVRSADIQAHLGRPHEAVMSLLTAIERQPHDAQLYKRLSEAQASNQQAQAALLACQEAIARAPEDLAIRRACAQLATWTGESDLAAWYWQTILKADPHNAEARLGLARLHTWAGRYRDGLAGYRSYLDLRPEDRSVWLEYAQARIWKGDYAGARQTLDHYQAAFGADDAYHARLARLLVRAGRPAAAAELNAPLLAKAPDDYDLRITDTLIRRDHREPRAARESLAELERLQPQSRDTFDLRRFVLTPQRSSVEGRFSFSDDSDDIRILRGELLGTAQLSPEFSLLAGGAWEGLRARAGSGFEAPNGNTQVNHASGWLGARWRVNPLLGLDGRLGGAWVDDGDDLVIGRAGIDLDPHDRFSARLQYDRALYAVSPRSVALGIRSDGGTASVSWRPTLLTTVYAQGGYAELSDANRRWEAILAPRYAVLRGAHFNLDLGLLGWWFGFDRDLDHGYYDPERYERYAVQGLGLWKISDDDQVSLILSLGEQRDSFEDRFDFGTDLLVEGVFGLYRDWMLKLGGGYTDRSRASGAYDAWLGYLSLTRRF